jgi:hypothetical protein
MFKFIFFLFLFLSEYSKNIKNENTNTLQTPNSIPNSQSFDQFHNSGQVNFPNNDHNSTANKQNMNSQSGNLVFETKLKIIEILQVYNYFYF